MCMCVCMYVSQVPDQNDIPQAYCIVKIYHSALEPSIYGHKLFLQEHLFFVLFSSFFSR